MKRTAIAFAVAALAVPAAQAAPSFASSAKAPLGASAVQRGEVRIVGTVTKLTANKVTVTNAKRSRTFQIPAGFNLRGIMKGDRVQAEGEKNGGKLVLTSIHREDSLAAFGSATSSAQRHGADDPAGHDKNDDRGGKKGGGNDDGPNHR